MEEHRHSLSASAGYTRASNMGPHTRFLQFVGYVLTPTVWRFGIAEDERMNDLVGAINAFQANAMFMTPTAISLLRPADVPCIKDVILGGEVPKRESLLSWAPMVRLTNGYGPAEAAVCAVMKTCLSPDTAPSSAGKTICCKTWVVDLLDDRRLAPVGAVGELWLEGPSVTRGYLGLKEETSEAFLSRPPFLQGNEAAPKWRFSCTGNLACYGADGDIRNLGRRDTQGNFGAGGLSCLKSSTVPPNFSEAL
ncbi:Nonribosomal peptide synthetase 12-like protein 1 [Colletotrichum chlorophyti]|uniref:Nonribosomal peptide synthetase 12-like protein 1 n=1 Tax=Colletotrichum chlorophyti TaxID=708187 RepID=A0A1Q8S7Z1_9PEZI|nr:Nonribosomal peptide synthetase 12-like protein 1 [Colletotrichum chlorophyti]